MSRKQKGIVTFICEKCGDDFDVDFKEYKELPDFCKCCEKTIEPEEYKETEQQRITDGIQRGII